jgi:hypothetical protein
VGRGGGCGSASGEAGGARLRAAAGVACHSMDTSPWRVTRGRRISLTFLPSPSPARSPLIPIS